MRGLQVGCLVTSLERFDQYQQIAALIQQHMDVASWDCSQVCRWLRIVHIDSNEFDREEIDGAALLALTEEDLRNLLQNSKDLVTAIHQFQESFRNLCMIWGQFGSECSNSYLEESSELVPFELTSCSLLSSMYKDESKIAESVDFLQQTPPFKYIIPYGELKSLKKYSDLG